MTGINSQSSVINVGEVVEKTTNRKVTLTVVALCFIIMFVDGYDNGIISNAAPILIKQWHVSTAIFAPVFSAATFGWMVGAAVIGALADKLGRKKSMVIGSCIFTVGTLLVIFADNISTLTALRFFTGFGIGAAVPPAIVLTSEYSNSKSRAKNITIMFSGFVIGQTVGSLLATWLIPNFGWHSMFIVGFFAPIFAIIATIFLLPESIKWLAIRGKKEKQRNLLTGILRKLDPEIKIDANTQFIADEEKKEKYSVKLLFKGKLAIITPLLWFYYVISSLGLFFVGSWLPQLFVQQGYTVAQASYWNGITGILGILGVILVGYWIDIVGFKWACVFPFLGMIFTAMTGNLTGTAFIIVISIASFFRNGEHSILTAIAPNLYPVSIRSQADSYAVAIAKIGSICGPLVGGVLMATGMSMSTLWYIVAAPFALCTICSYTLGYMYEKYIDVKTISTASGRNERF